MRLPPYGKSIDKSNDVIWIWAGEPQRINQSIKTFSKNTLAFYPPNDPKKFAWLVENRKIILVHFFEPENFWVKSITLALLKAGSSDIAEISWPYCGAWWNPHYDFYAQCFLNVEESLVINNYTRN